MSKLEKLKGLLWYDYYILFNKVLLSLSVIYTYYCTDLVVVVNAKFITLKGFYLFILGAESIYKFVRSEYKLFDIFKLKGIPKYAIITSILFLLFALSIAWIDFLEIKLR